MGDKVKLYHPGVYGFECPACGFLHAYHTEGYEHEGPLWSFNGSLQKPTFSPSLLVKWEENGVKKFCHLWIEDGVIRFPSDNEHRLSGQSFEMKDIDD